MRADALRNQELLLAAAVDLILEVGTEPPLDAIARRAGVGIGTLYRHFPDREVLLNAVAIHVLDQNSAVATTAISDGRDGHDALRRYMHASVDRGVGVLNLIHPLVDSHEWTTRRTESATHLGAILRWGHEDGSIRVEVEPVDIVFAIIRFSRPVAIGLAHGDERALAHRHLDIYIDGLGSGDRARTPLSAPAAMSRFAAS